nr:hypothetical protein CFP56_70227 [Quercus suber]
MVLLSSSTGWPAQTSPHRPMPYAGRFCAPERPEHRIFAGVRLVICSFTPLREMRLITHSSADSELRDALNNGHAKAKLCSVVHRIIALDGTRPLVQTFLSHVNMYPARPHGTAHE